jgi:hypothetical protein
MEERIRAQLVEQLDQITKLYENLAQRTPHRDLSGVPESEHHKLVAMSRAAIRRIAGPSSEYMRHVEMVLEDDRKGWIGSKLTAIVGVVQSLRGDLVAGYLRTLGELLHAEVFGDLLEMADYLQGGGYKDAAAIITGAALESHLRRLAESNGIVVEEEGRPRKADQLNADLAKKEIYSKLDQKSVTAWLDLRNKAAHGKFAEYSKDQVALLMAGVRDFMLRYPA